MSHFDQPEFQGYVALCRELRLERRFVEGDYAAWTDSPDGPWTVLLTDGAAAHAGHRALSGYGPGGFAYSIWLPRLDQWLAMLEKAGERDAVLQVCRHGVDFTVAWTDGYGIAEQSGRGATREEAAARLWMAVTGREVRA